MSQVVTGLEPEASSAFPGQAHDGLQQSQYLVVVPVPEASALTWRKKGIRARSVLVGSCILNKLKVMTSTMDGEVEPKVWYVWPLTAND